MRAYFLPPRFYSRHYPYTGVKKKMVCTKHVRAVLNANRFLYQLCFKQHCHLAKHNASLAAFLPYSDIKEQVADLFAITSFYNLA